MLPSFFSQSSLMTAFLDGGGLMWFSLILALCLLLLLGLLGWHLRLFLARIDHQATILDKHLGDLKNQSEQIVLALGDLAQNAQAQHQQLVEAIQQISITAATSASTTPPKEEAEDRIQTPVDSIPTRELADPSATPALAEAIALLATPDLNYPDNLLKARELLLPLAEGPQQKDALLALSETLFWLGDIATNKVDQEKYHGEGVNYGKRSVELAPDSAAANLWYAANMGAHGMARGIMSSLFYLTDIEKHGKKAMELDRSYFYSAPLRLMGRFYHQAPGWPLGNGDKDKAIKLLQEAASDAPEFLLNGLYLAQVLIDKRKKKEARQALEAVIQNKNATIMADYQERVRNQARQLLAKV